jgi:hypothetical protein
MSVPSCSGSIKYVIVENESSNKILVSLSDNKEVHGMTKTEKKSQE